MSRLSFWVFTIFDFSQKKPLRFFGWANVWVFWDNNSSKQRLIELKFWTKVVLIVVQMLFKPF